MPVSTYGASKLAGEALIASYGHMFGIARPRLPLRQRRRARTRPTASGSTSCASCSTTRRGSRSSATAARASRTSTSTTCSPRCCSPDRERSRALRASFNVATGDYITVTEIAELAVECLGLDPASVELEYSGGDRGWKGDVPVVRLATERIRALGWANRYDSREALRASMLAMLDDARAGRLW